MGQHYNVKKYCTGLLQGGLRGNDDTYSLCGNCDVLAPTDRQQHYGPIYTTILIHFIYMGETCNTIITKTRRLHIYPIPQSLLPYEKGREGGKIRPCYQRYNTIAVLVWTFPVNISPSIHELFIGHGRNTDHKLSLIYLILSFSSIMNFTTVWSVRRGQYWFTRTSIWSFWRHCNPHRGERGIKFFCYHTYTSNSSKVST